MVFRYLRLLCWSKHSSKPSNSICVQQAYCCLIILYTVKNLLVAEQTVTNIYKQPKISCRNTRNRPFLHQYCWRSRLSTSSLRWSIKFVISATRARFRCTSSSSCTWSISVFIQAFILVMMSSSLLSIFRRWISWEDVTAFITVSLSTINCNRDRGVKCRCSYCIVWELSPLNIAFKLSLTFNLATICLPFSSPQKRPHQAHF